MSCSEVLRCVRAVAAHRVWVWGHLAQASRDSGRCGKGKQPLPSPHGVTRCSSEAELLPRRPQHWGSSPLPLGT